MCLDADGLPTEAQSYGVGAHTMRNPGCECCGEREPETMGAVDVEWLNTRRGLIGLSRVETERPAGRPPYVTWIWFTESGDTGAVDGEAGRAMAITDAYVAMVRSGTRCAY